MDVLTHLTQTKEKENIWGEKERELGEERKERERRREKGVKLKSSLN